MGKDREFFTLFIIFILVFSLLSLLTEQRLRALDVYEVLPRLHVVAPSEAGEEGETESHAPGSQLQSPLSPDLTPDK
ncbi:MAG TPA: hypothetical protein P5333_16350 [Caldilinea sp.]|nr:hypothetical protein [Caldilinea sp.]